MGRSGEPRQLRANSLARPAVRGRLVSLGARHGLVKDAAAAVTEARGACPFAASLPLASSRTRTHCRFANCATSWREGGISHGGGREEAAARERAEAERALDEAIEESFPASDPLASTRTTAGGPDHPSKAPLGVRSERRG
jgi:hypothetical protein